MIIWIKKILDCFDLDQYDFYTKEFQKNEVIINPIQKNHELLFIVKGIIAVYAILEDGTMRFVSMSDEFTMLGDIEFVIGGYPTYFVEARSKVQAVCLDLDQEKEKLNQDITFMHYIMHLLVDKLQHHGTNIVLMTNVEERLMNYIENNGNELTNIEQAAYNLHCSKRQLQRVLKKLVQEGILTKIKKGVYRK